MSKRKKSEEEDGKWKKKIRKTKIDWSQKKER